MSSDVGDVELIQIVLRSLSNGEEYNLIQQATNIDIYEGLDSMTVSANITIEDPFDLLTTFPIVGEEEVIIEFMTPGSDTSSTYTFMVNDISNIEISENGRFRRYTLECLTKEFLINMSRIYSRRYNEPFENTIQNIVRQELQSDKNLTIETGIKGIFDHLISNKQPLQVIDLCRDRAVSGSYSSSYFVFFEDRNGYNFTTIENLFVQRRESIGDKVFYYETGNRNSIRSINQRNILSYVAPILGNNARKIAGASLRSVTRSFDVLTGNIVEYDYDNERDYSSFEKADEETFDYNSEEYLNLFGQNNARKFFSVKDTSRAEDFHDSRIGFKRAYEQKLSQFMTNIRIYGDNEITAGDVITINMPEVSSFTEGQETESRLFAENYMVYRLRHMIQRGDDGFDHFMSCSLIKGSFTGRI